MDLITVSSVSEPRTRGELHFGDGDIPLGGGTWLYSEPQEGVTGLVDLTALEWPAIEIADDRLTIAATCTIAELAGLRSHTEWTAAPLFWQAANSLLASYKIWNTATVGGNICISLPAGPMTSLGSALDAVAVIWTIDGGTRRTPVAEFVTGVRSNTLEHGEVLRAIEIPAESLKARTAFRRIALSPLGRSGTLVIGRVDPTGEAVFTVTAGTTHPWVFRFEGIPASGALEKALDTIDDWYDDPHGAPDWREAMSRLFAEEIRSELA
jgi:CO/xanthine dehydrogenase FAD-binding subunit